MDHEDFVTYEQAVKLKELGFNWKCETFWDDEGSPQEHEWVIKNYHDYPYVTNNEDCTMLRPTLAQAQKWLRENEIEVGVFAEFDGELRTEQWMWLMRKFNTHLYETVFPEGINYDSYEAALSAGIDAALDLKGQHNGNQN